MNKDIESFNDKEVGCEELYDWCKKDKLTNKKYHL